jgi:hypothetical protein
MSTPRTGWRDADTTAYNSRQEFKTVFYAIGVSLVKTTGCCTSVRVSYSLVFNNAPWLSFTVGKRAKDGFCVKIV